MYQYKFIGYNKSITLAQDFECGRDFVRMGEGSILEISIPCTYFCSESKIALNNKIYFLKEGLSKPIKHYSIERTLMSEIF
jgi:hypothetical protein